MKSNEEKISVLEKENKELKKAVSQLVRRVQLLERKTQQTYHSTRTNESRINQISQTMSRRNV